jgi:hydroxyacylglutathione hydrolase
MLFERISAEGLAHFSYIIGTGKTAFVVDPRRDCQIYQDIARREGIVISHIFETHRNEDFVTGSLELMERTGARTYHGPGLDWGYGIELKEGDSYEFDQLELQAIHTPGHTYEHMAFALYDRKAGEDAFAVFTGDALFVGEVGRTDLPGPEHVDRLTRALYHSINNKILSLGNGALVCPAHGAGSVCGRDINEREMSTIGLERAQNPMLRLSEEEFVRRKMNEHMDRPPYFSVMESMNLGRRIPLDRLPDPRPMTPNEIETEIRDGAALLDVRMQESFAGAYIKGAINIWVDGLASYAGWLLPYDRPLVLVVADPLQLDRVVRILIRMGYDNIIGYLKGGMSQWLKEGKDYDALPTMNVHQVKQGYEKGEIFLLDPRPNHEWEDYRVPGAHHIFVGELEKRVSEVPRDKTVACICSSGFRGSMAAAILRQKGFGNARNVLGGIGAWKAAGYEVEDRE